MYDILNLDDIWDSDEVKFTTFDDAAANTGRGTATTNKPTKIINIINTANNLPSNSVIFVFKIFPIITFFPDIIFYFSLLS